MPESGRPSFPSLDHLLDGLTAKGCPVPQTLPHEAAEERNLGQLKAPDRPDPLAGKTAEEIGERLRAAGVKEHQEVVPDKSAEAIGQDLKDRGVEHSPEPLEAETE